MNIKDLDLSGAKVTGINKAALPTAKAQCYPAGTTIVQFSTRVRPVPWKVSIVKRGKGPPTNPKFAQWQQVLRSEAYRAMGFKLPHSGPFIIHISIDCVRRPQWEQPDDDNLVKGIKDALQGSAHRSPIAYLDDKQSRGNHVRYNPDALENLTVVHVVAS